MGCEAVFVVDAVRRHIAPGAIGKEGVWTAPIAGTRLLTLLGYPRAQELARDFMMQICISI